MNQFSVTRSYKANFQTKGSKFIAYLTPCTNRTNADEELNKVKQLHPNATHHCYAYRVDPSVCKEFSQDDGEPGGTAGLPILNVLKSASLVNIFCTVVRYYGGTNLGRSGLIDAYSETTTRALKIARLIKIIPTIQYRIVYQYDKQSLIEKLKHTFTLYEVESDYTDKVQLLLECPLHQNSAFEKRLERISHRLISFEKKSKSFHIP